jgi:hypothetical protein
VARIRYLKPEFFSDEDLSELPFQARLAFAGLWCYADKAGRLEDRPKFLKAMIFPYDNIDMEKQLQLLSNGKGFIQRYEIENKGYIQITSWHRHQVPHHTEKESTFPEPPLRTPLKDKEKDKEKGASPDAEFHNGSITVKEPLKKIYGEFKNVLLKDEEIEKLNAKFGVQETNNKIENLSTYLASKGKKYANHYATILAWERKNPTPIKSAPVLKEGTIGMPDWIEKAAKEGWKI